MKQKHLYYLWAFAFILCAGLGFIPEASGFGAAALLLVSLLFFVPPVWLLLKALGAGDRGTVLRLRYLSIASLTLTLVLLVLNLLSVSAPKWVGDVLYALLVIASAPMVCSRYYLLPVFLWGALLTGTFMKKKV